MILKHLLEDLSRIAASAHPYAETNVNGVELNEAGVFFGYDTTDLDQTKEDLTRAEDDLRKASLEFDELEKEKEGVEDELNKLTEWANQIKADGIGAAFGEFRICFTMRRLRRLFPNGII